MTGIFVPWSDRANSPGWIEDGSGCHIWIGARTGNGYGNVWADGRVQPIHRVRYEREIGPIPDGMELDHFACDRGANGCCNPHHCRPVTHRENVLRGDGITSLCLAKTHCLRGHPLSGDNLKVRTGTRKGERDCKQCHRDRMRAYMRAYRAAGRR
jgi:hypothetical protein